jgi:predicted Zn-ribbon and HTH transcriptional regulator
MDRNELPREARHLGVSSGACKMISNPMVHLAQTVQLSCSDTNTISKQTEIRFDMTHVTKEFRRVHPKLLLRLCYVRCKQCIYLALRLALSPNRPKQASTWASSPRRTIGCVQSEFQAYGSFGTNHAPILLRHKHHLWMDQNGIPHEPRHLGVPSGASKMISKPMVRLAQTVHLSFIRLALSPNRPKQASTWASSPRRTIGCVQNDFYVWCKLWTNLALTLKPSPNGPKQDLTWPTSHRSSIGSIQNDFWAYGTFDANNPPILRQD